VCLLMTKNCSCWKGLLHGFQVSDKMVPDELVKLIDILNPKNKPGRVTVIVRMGAENMRVKLPHLIRAVRRAGQIVTWVSDPMHGNTIKAPSGLKTRSFDAIRVISLILYSFFQDIYFCFIPNFRSIQKWQKVWSLLGHCFLILDHACNLTHKCFLWIGNSLMFVFSNPEIQSSWWIKLMIKLFITSTYSSKVVLPWNIWIWQIILR